MKKILLLSSLLFFAFISLQSQVTYTANNQVTPYEGIFRPGVNPGYYGSYKNDILLTNISGGNPASGNEGVGVRTYRSSLPEFITLIYDYPTWEGVYAYYDALGMKDNTMIVGFAHPDHADPIEYCPGIPTDMFANLYEPIFDGGLNGTPINENNYFARYMWDLLETMGDQVKFWEIWNEPGFDYSGAAGWLNPGQPGNWWENNPDPCDYKLRAPIFHFVRTMRIAYQVIKTHSPDDYVVLSGVGYESFLDAVLRNTDNPIDGSETSDYPLGGGAYFDVMGFHSYPHFDGSMRYWDNSIGGFAYERHSDRGVEGFLAKRDVRKDHLAEFGYDGVTYPLKEWMITEYNVPRVAFPDPSNPNINLFGSDEGARNFIMKSYITAMIEDLIQIHPYQIAERETTANADDSFDHMGFFEKFEGIDYLNQNVHEQGIGYKTSTDLLFRKEYDEAQTNQMDLPQGVKGAAFKNSFGEYTYALWARTSIDNSEVASANYSFPANMNVGNLEKYNWDFGLTGNTQNISSQNIALTGAPIFLVPASNMEVGEITMSCPIDSVGIVLTATQQEGGTTFSWVTPTATTTCPLGGLTITQTKGLSSGSFFAIGGDVIAYEATDGCGNVVECAFTIGVRSSGGGIGDATTGCHASREGFIYLGIYGGHKYFVSSDAMTYAEGVAKAASHGAYLASIDDAGENNYISFWNSAQVFIGLNDVAQEGVEVWESGANVSYTNYEDSSCTWCETNNENNDAVEFHPWNGKWNWIPATDVRQILIEVPCAETLGCGCPTTNEPVCGSNGVTYLNACEAECAGIFNYQYGSCGGTNCQTGSTTVIQCSDGDPCTVNDVETILDVTGVVCIPCMGVPEDCATSVTSIVSCDDGDPNTINDQQTILACSGIICVPCAGIPNNGGCNAPASVSGFTTIGEFGNSKYYISNDVARAVDGQTEAETHGGYLAVISSQEENDFIQQNISEMSYIGLNDENVEGTLEWFNGEPLTYNNVNPCGFCNENSEDQDFVIMAPWDGAWSFSNFFNSRKYVMEIPCGGTPPTGEITLNCPGDINATVPSGQTTVSVNYDKPTATTTCPDGGVSVNISGSGGPTFGGISLQEGVYPVSWTATDACGNSETCTFTITVTSEGGGGGDCPDEIAGFTVIGEFGASKYYLSNDISRPVDAQAVAESYGGYLAAVGSAEENNFIQQGIDEMTYIGLNDYDSEGTFAWFNGEPVTFNNINVCGFCNENSEEMDFVIMAPWNGDWSFSNFYNNRKYVMEIPCDGVIQDGITINGCSSDVTLVGTHANNYTENHTWNIPTATTTCPDGGLTVTQLAGPEPGDGEFFPVPSGHPIVYEFTDACGNTEQCIFFIYVNPEAPEYICPADITITATSATGVIVEYGDPTLNSYCTADLENYELINGLASGSEFPIGTTTVTLRNVLLGGAAYCQYFELCSFTVTVLDPNGGGCPQSIPNFSALGEFGNSAYFISNDVSRPVDAEAVANTHGGHLVTVNSQAENDFLYPQISELVYIGMNDYDSENTLEWFSGETVNYTNFDICGFCNSNTEEMDFAVMHSWNGGWSWSNFFNQRKYIIEVPCTSTVQNFPLSNIILDQQMENVKPLLGKIIPNPAMDHIFTQIKTTIAREIDVQIFDATGTLLKSERVSLFKGNNTTRIDISDLPSGFYFVKIPQAARAFSTERFVKVGE